MLNWFGHVERNSDERIAKKMYYGKVSGKRDRFFSSVHPRKHSIKDNGGRSRKKYEEEGMYEEVYDSGRGERGITPFSLTTPLGINREAKLSYINNIYCY